MRGWNMTRVRFERSSTLLAFVSGPGGRAEVRLNCDPCSSPVAKIVIRMETKRYTLDGVILERDLVISDPGLTLQHAVTLAEAKVAVA